MFLAELFDRKQPSLQTSLRNAVLDLLTPLSSHGASTVSIDTLVARLQNLDLGIEITPDVIRDCVTPNSIPFVTNVDDTAIYLNGSEPDNGEDMDLGDDEPATPVDPVKDAAKKKASERIKPSTPTPKSPQKLPF